MEDPNDRPLSLFVNMNDEAAVAKFEAMALDMKPVNGIVQPPIHPPEDKPHRSTDALQYVLNTVIPTLKKHKCIWYFLAPVDAVDLNLPDYHSIILYPMDLYTIIRRLQNCYYYDLNECIQDFQLIFYNCYKYYKAPHFMVRMAKEVEKEFVEMMNHYLKEANKGVNQTADGSSQSEPVEVITQSPPRKNRKVSTCQESGQPIRNPSEYLPETPATWKTNVEKPVNKKISDPMTYCHNVLNELFSEKHAHYASIFYQQLNDYNNIIKKPMDLNTVKAKLENGVYKAPTEFASDIRLIFTNVYKHYGPNDEVVAMAYKLQGVFEMKYAKMPDESAPMEIVSTAPPVREGTCSRCSFEPSGSTSSDSKEEKIEKTLKLQNKSIKKTPKNAKQAPSPGEPSALTPARTKKTPKNAKQASSAGASALTPARTKKTPKNAKRAPSLAEPSALTPARTKKTPKNAKRAPCPAKPSALTPSRTKKTPKIAKRAPSPAEPSASTPSRTKKTLKNAKRAPSPAEPSASTPSRTKKTPKNAKRAPSPAEPSTLTPARTKNTPKNSKRAPSPAEPSASTPSRTKKTPKNAKRAPSPAEPSTLTPARTKNTPKNSKRAPSAAEPSALTPARTKKTPKNAKPVSYYEKQQPSRF